MHVVIWILYFFFENGIAFILAPESLSLTSTLVFFLLNASIFYANCFFILPFTLPRKRYTLLILMTLSLCLLYLLLNYLITNFLQSRNIDTIYSLKIPRDFVILRVFRFLYFISLSYAYYLAVNTIRTERRLRKLDEARMEEARKKARLEKEMLTNELNYLRYQIHPHFLFNTLSFIYTQVLNCSKEAAQSVMLLSDIMRYALHHSEEGKVEVESEIQHIRNLITIHQLRFNNRLCIQLELEDSVEFKFRRIAPLLLITFVENALKYGELQEPENPLLIRINMHDGHLQFFIRNKKKIMTHMPVSGGIGLANVKRRLSLMYSPDQYTLDIKDEHCFYAVHLNLNL